MESAKIFDLFSFELSQRPIEYYTRRQYELWLRRYQEFLRNKQTELLNSSSGTVSTYITYCKRQGYSNSTVNNNLRIIDGLYHFLVTQRWLLYNPAKHVKKLVRRKYIYAPIESNSLKYIVQRYQKNGQSDRNKIIFELVKAGCLSAKDIVELRLCDLLLQRNSLLARSGSKRKNPIQLSNETTVALRQYLNCKAIKSEFVFTTNTGSRISRVTVYALVRRAMLKCKLPSHVINGLSTLRMSEGIRLIDAGKTSQEIRTLLNTKYHSVIIDRFLPASELKLCHSRSHPKGSR